jgi:hypothetical protein
LAANNTWTGTNLFQNNVTVDVSWSYNGTTLNLGSSGHLGTINLSGSTSGTTTLVPNVAASGTLTLPAPASSDTLVGKATTDTFTNKTFDTAGTGNSLKINGTAVSDKTGTGKVVLDTSPVLTTPNVGAAVGSSILVNGSAGVGYSTGAGGTVTQATNKSTGVHLDKICGQIVTTNANITNNLLGTGKVSFTLTNSTIAATDTVVVCIASGAANSSSYSIGVGAVASGSCDIYIVNVSAGTLGEALTINFSVIKSVAS